MALIVGLPAFSPTCALSRLKCVAGIGLRCLNVFIIQATGKAMYKVRNETTRFSVVVKGEVSAAVDLLAERQDLVSSAKIKPILLANSKEFGAVNCWRILLINLLRRTLSIC